MRDVARISAGDPSAFVARKAVVRGVALIGEPADPSQPLLKRAFALAQACVNEDAADAPTLATNGRCPGTPPCCPIADAT